MSNLVKFDNGRESVTYELATFWQRLAARLIDTAIILIPNFIVPIFPAWFYWAMQQSGERQATVGQRAVGIKVVNKNGERINFRQASAKLFANYLSIFTFLLGYLMFFFNAKNQCLHDYLSGCIVVKARPVESEGDIQRHLVE